MSVNTVRRIAAKIMKVGESRIKIKPEDVKKASEALTSDDVRALISAGSIWSLRVKGIPRIRAKLKHAKMKKGRRSGSGSKKGAKYASVPQKDLWMAKTRLQRRTLRELKDSKRLKEGIYRKAYKMIKGNAWRSKGAMLAHFEDAKWVVQAPKKEAQPAPASAAPAEKK